MSTVQYYGADQVRKVLSWCMINEAVKEAFKSVSKCSGKENENKSYANQPPRSVTVAGDSRSQLLLTMPAFVGNYQMKTRAGNGDECTTRNTLACKLVTSFSENSKRQPPLPNILAHILLLNSETGQLESIVEGTDITAWRTASASIVATEYLYFHRSSNKDNVDINKPVNVAIIGCGVQGQSHALGMCSTYNVCNINLWNRTTSKAESLASLLRSEYPKINVEVSSNPAIAVSDADIICVATYSPDPLINYEMIKKTGVHINTVGAGEVHFGEVAQDIYDKSQVFIDSWANAEKELKDLKANFVAEVGEVIKNGIHPQQNQITIFQSMGMAAEDATVAHAVVEAIKSLDQQ